MAHPSWVLAHKRNGTEIKLINGHYYLYEVSSIWDKALKRSRKRSGKCLGRIYPDNLSSISEASTGEETIKSSVSSHVGVKEYGASSYLYESHQSTWLVALKALFPNWYKELFALSLFRLLHQSPLKNISTHYEQSYISELLPNCHLGGKSLTALLREVGSQRDQIVACLQKQMQGNSFILLDVTNIVSFSEYLDIAHLGYNSQQQYDPQVNLLFIFASDLSIPVYYRLLPGNIRDVSAMKKSIQESGLSKVTIVADKGFYSKKNVAELDEAGLKYLLPLRRNSQLVDYDPLKISDKKDVSYCYFNNQLIWFYAQTTSDGKRLIVFLNDFVKAKEQQDYMNRVQSKQGNYSLEKFIEKQHAFGTLALLTNLENDITPEEIYKHYKARADIEQLFDTFKNNLNADRTYMRGMQEMEAWLFINFLAICYYYQLYNLLKKQNLLSKYSPKDILLHLAGIKAIKMAGKWEVAETPKKSKKIFELIKFNPKPIP